MDFLGLVNFLGDLAIELTGLAFLIALVAALWFAASSLMSLIKKGDSRGQMGSQDVTWGAIFTKMMVSSLLFTAASTLDSFVQLSDGSQARNALAYVQGAAGASNPVVTATWAAIKNWCLFVGVAGFIRGWFLLIAASKGGHDGGDKFWQSLWHIVGGSFVVNVFS